MTFIINVSHESGNKTTALIQFFDLFPFYTKSNKHFNALTTSYISRL